MKPKTRRRKTSAAKCANHPRRNAVGDLSRRLCKECMDHATKFYRHWKFRHSVPNKLKHRKGLASVYENVGDEEFRVSTTGTVIRKPKP
jgi:hypothetical protein